MAGILLAVVVLGLAAAGVAGAFAGSERQRAVQVVTSPPTPSATAAPSSTTPPATAPPATAPAVPVAPATPPPAAAPSPTAPVRVVIPGRDVDVPVDPVGVAADGQMEIPPLAERGGWYRFGADPGDPAGTTVVAAHVDSIASGGTGPFVHLVDVRPGDAVEVALADGSTRTYAVDAVTRFPKDEARWPDVFTRDGPPRLALVTCGGAFDRDTRHYVDNVLVTATPVGA
ncbi:class F sortase [Cellulomonas sp. Y8]|uniref:class F sortase n=1 Tax=Cellulomonas sp. Y8 TaxID=2591145 RepID=UPI00143D9792|nr:class F sortase [Cellulomonas sp. Y8]